MDEKEKQPVTQPPQQEQNAGQELTDDQAEKIAGGHRSVTFP